MLKVFRESHTHPSGRVIVATFQWESVSLCVMCVYLPSGLQTGSRTSSKARTNQQLGFDLCKYIDEKRSLHTHVIICGDLNECHNDERSPVGRFPPPQFIPKILGQSMTDCGRLHHRNTFLYRCRSSGELRSSKLDRFLVSNKIAENMTEYKTIEGSPLESPHRPVILSFSLDSTDVNDFDRLPDYPFHHKHLTVYDRSPDAISRVCSELDAIFGTREIPHTFDSVDDLQQIFEDTASVLRKTVRRHTKTTSISDSVQLFDRTLRQTRQDIRSLKHFLTTYLCETETPSVDEFHKRFPSTRRHTCEQTAIRHGLIPPFTSEIDSWRHYVQSLTDYARELRSRVRRRRANTLSQRRSRIFHSDRKQFYSRYVDGHQPASYPSRIYDSVSDKIVSEPDQLANTLCREAESLLCQPRPPPDDPPDWMRDLYRFNAKGVDPRIWDVLMRDIEPHEVLDVISEGDKSPGASGITRLVLRLITSDSYRENGSPNATLHYITSLLNSYLRSGFCCQYASIGLLVLTPKPGKLFSLKYKDKRPLTMMNEIPKIVHLTLGKRLCKISTENSLLHPANQAYLLGTSTYEPSRILIDRIEQCIKHDLSLAGIFYDKSKAFDRLLWWHIEWALRRFGIPKSFGNFIFTYLRCAKTHIRTAYGLTRAIDILNSARQGDPLSQYLWQLCIEPLHHRLNAEPYQSSLLSYPFSHSLGFSDDAGILSSDP